MIYEMRTYDLKRGSVREVEKRFAEAYEHRKKHSKLAAFWHTEIGLLNQVVHLWPYKDLEERSRIRAVAAKDSNWPPKISEFIVRQQSDILIPLNCSPEVTPANVGPFFEMRIYTISPGGLPGIQKIWAEALEWRLKFGPVVGLFHSEIGALNKFIHIWPYKSLNDRMEIREKAKAPGKWPPHQKSLAEGGGGYELVIQENKILMPAAFSPVQ